MKKLLYLFAFSAVFLTSCSSSDSSSTATTESDVLITKTIETSASDNSVLTTNFTYNGKKLIGSTDSEGYHEVFTYVGDLISSIKAYDDTNTLITEETFTYNGNNLLISYLLNDYTTDHGRREEFVHVSNDNISYSVYNGTTTEQPTSLLETGSIHFANGEISHINTEVPSVGNTYTRTYTYDTKNNPFKNVTGYDKLSFLNEEANGVTHNILTDAFAEANQSSITTSTYTYNSLNFPVTGFEMEGTDTTTQVSTQYFYNN
jgi:hypothetical protein